MATDNSTTPGTFLPWAGKKVCQEQVEQELMFLWHLAADNMRISQNMNVRTSVLNLVICAQDAKTAHKASMLLRDLASTHIARVTLIILDMRNDAPTDVSTWVTLRSFPIVSDIMRHHFEQITVSVRGTAVQSAATIVQQLLKPDLPVYLWWLHDLPSNETVFKQFAEISSRVIIDSSDFTHPEQRIHTLASLEQTATNHALSDLNWSRVTAWRELIAQFFDVAEYRPYLARCTQIEIEHVVVPPTEFLTAEKGARVIKPISALFLAAWLKTRLGWQLSYEQDHNFRDSLSGTYAWHMQQRRPSQQLLQTLEVQPNGTQRRVQEQDGIQFYIRPRTTINSIAGTLCLVRLTCYDNGEEASFTIARGDDDDHVQTSVELPGNTPPPRTVSIAKTHKERNLLRNEFEITGRDYLYEDTLREVSALLG
ncbi:MAG TPA: glucose-6-phosphate dehydrogenase assembly protein OpcA [Dictyobacter sp.]|nr:glucose-6-phosphate dehydrogenase assembly protein OpcA [Dictyobacter sp.]